VDYVMSPQSDSHYVKQLINMNIVLVADETIHYYTVWAR